MIFTWKVAVAVDEAAINMISSCVGEQPAKTPRSS